MSAPSVASQASAYLRLDVAGTDCALPRMAVAEVLPLPALNRLPGDGGWLVGFANLGGRALPVLDLARLLNLREGEAKTGLYAHLVLSRDRSLAWLVDRVVDVVSVPAEAHRTADPEASLNGCVAAGLALGDRLVPALDPARLLTAAEAGRIAALTCAAEVRLAALQEFPSVPPVTRG